MVNVAPLVITISLTPNVIFPELKVTFVFTLIEVPKVTLVPLLITMNAKRLVVPVALKVPATVCVLPVKNTARSLWVNVPLLVRLPATYKSPPESVPKVSAVVTVMLPPTVSAADLPVMVNVPALIVRLPFIARAVAASPFSNVKVVPAAIVTLLG